MISVSPRIAARARERYKVASVKDDRFDDFVLAVLCAIETVLARGRSLLTLDMGGAAITTQLGTAISDQIPRRLSRTQQVRISNRLFS